jgi:hypothetical protein
LVLAYSGGAAGREFEPCSSHVSHRSFPPIFSGQPHTWIRHNGQGDVPVTCEVWMISDTFQPRAASSYIGVGLACALRGVCESVCGGVSWDVSSDNCRNNNKKREDPTVTPESQAKSWPLTREKPAAKIWTPAQPRIGRAQPGIQGGPSGPRRGTSA